MRHPLLYFSIFWLVILCVQAPDVNADLGLRCGSRLITPGDTIERVLNECGEPSFVESWEEERIHHHPYQYPYNDTDHYRYGPVHRIIVHVIVEEWTYNHGPSRFVERVRFENGRVRKIFNEGYGWIGADAIYSIAHHPDRIIWLFGDTFVGRIEDGRRLDAVIINNSVAVQTGMSPDAAEIGFYFGRRANGEPAALIEPPDGRGWFWIYDGIRTEGGLYLFLVQIERSEDSSVFGFRLIGNWLCRIDNPDDSPDLWQISQKRLPWHSDSIQQTVLFGSALLAVDNYLYVYGARDRSTDGRLQKGMIAARVPLDRIDHLSQWRFFKDGQWSSEYTDASIVSDDVANEYSVSYMHRLGKYVLVYSEAGLSPNILARMAVRPTGPWGKPIHIYRCPEAGWDTRIFCYAAKGHPEVSTEAGELIVTYVSNATELEMLEADARLYRPRFLRVRFHP